MANIQSIAIARAAVAYAGKDAKISVQDFLPYEIDKPKRISLRTAKIFMNLLNENKLPAKIVSVCGELIDEIVEMIK